MEAASTSETSVTFYHTTQRSNLKDSHLENSVLVENLTEPLVLMGGQY
jgi:hypothetical protein